jgi:hypothetical protein
MFCTGRRKHQTKLILSRDEAEIQKIIEASTSTPTNSAVLLIMNTVGNKQSILSNIDKPLLHLQTSALSNLVIVVVLENSDGALDRRARDVNNSDPVVNEAVRYLDGFAVLVCFEVLNKDLAFAKLCVEHLTPLLRHSVYPKKGLPWGRLLRHPRLGCLDIMLKSLCSFLLQLRGIRSTREAQHKHANSLEHKRHFTHASRQRKHHPWPPVLPIRNQMLPEQIRARVINASPDSPPADQVRFFEGKGWMRRNPLKKTKASCILSRHKLGQ